MSPTPAHYPDASQLLKALAAGTTTSRALLDGYLERIAEKNPALNAVIALDIEAARLRADAADAARARGESWGVLHGLPMTIKDTYEVPGMVCAAGSPKYSQHMPSKPAYAVQRLLDAGAIVFGKTNVPYLASDLQSYNKVYGTTNNPWNVALTPGGSSGGAAAALAAGFTPLELGSDIGGSIRIPAHFCGVYGHKPTYGIISMRGHIPGPRGTLAEPALGVAGPMARTAADLALLLDVVAGTPPDMQPGWQLKLPPARHKALAKYRVLFWIDDVECPIDDQMRAVYTELKLKLIAAGVDVVVGAPQQISLGSLYAIYARQLSSVMLGAVPKAARVVMGWAAPTLSKIGKYVKAPQHVDQFSAGAGLSHIDWMISHERGLHLRDKFVSTFKYYDVILTPPTLTTAFAHDHSAAIGLRKVRVNGKARNYLDQFMWISPATLMGLPATSAPVGISASGAPVNIQIIGAPYEDKTTIQFAGLLAKVMGGFVKPPSY